MVTTVSNKCHEINVRNQSMNSKPAISAVSFLGRHDGALTYSEVVKELDMTPALLASRLAYKPALPSVFMHRGQPSINYISISEENLPEVEELDSTIKYKFSNILDLNDKKIELKHTSRPDKTKKTQKVGIILSGGPAPGGHNVITGIYDALKGANKNSEVYGFLNGPDGIVKNNYVVFDNKRSGSVDGHRIVNPDKIRNTGGFSVIGTGRTKLEEEKQFQQVLANCRDLGLTSIVIIGGDDSNTNAAVLAEWFQKNDADIQVIGCPKTIDGDLKNSAIETSFGFDTATKFYSHAISNLQRDNLSSRKQWHFCQVMGRAASNVALEVALQTHPNITVISEEVEQNQIGLNELVIDIADKISARASDGKNYGTVVIPEGLIEFIPETSSLITKIDGIFKTIEKYENGEKVIIDKRYNRALSKAKINYMYKNIYEMHQPKFESIKDELLKALIDGNSNEDAIVDKLKELDSVDSEFVDVVANYVKYLKTDFEYNAKVNTTTMRYISKKLDPESRKIFDKKLSNDVKIALLSEKDPHGNIKVSQIKTHEFIAKLVERELHKRGLESKSNVNFNPVYHEYGYDGRCDFPTTFDSNYCYALGYTAAELIEDGLTGYMATVQNLDKDTEDWKPAGIPIPSMMNMEERKGKMKPVIEKALVDLDDNPYKYFVSQRNKWAREDDYRVCSSTQFFGPKNVSNDIPITLKLEKAR